MALSAAHKAAFEAFWRAYPVRPDNPKAAAREVFARRVREGADPEAIAQAAGRYAAACRADGKDCKFIPHARTWLSQRRYEDFLEEAPASADLDAAGRHAGAGGAQPSPEHPLDFLRSEIDGAAWRSWIEPLQVRCTPAGLFTIVARTQFALDQVRARYGALIEDQVDGVAWTVAPKEAS